MGEYLENSYDSECEIFRVLFLYERKHMERFSNRAARHDSKNPKQRRMEQQKTGNSTA